MRKVLIDTNVLIDFFRGKFVAIDFLSTLDRPPAISVLTIAELHAGVKGKKEGVIVRNFLRSLEVIPVDGEIAELGGEYKNRYYRSHSVGLADSIIAATATSIGARLVSLNQKHFPMLSDVIVPY